MKRKPLDDASIDMTPMLDIVFIMLIFFIVTAVFLDERAIALTSPPDSVTVLEPQPAIIVYIDDINRVSVEGERVDLGSAADRVVRVVGDRGITAVQLSVSEAANLKSAVAVFDDLKTRGVNVSLKVVETQE